MRTLSISILKRQPQRNKIKRLKDEGGVCVEDQEGLGRVVKEYFQNLYSESLKYFGPVIEVVQPRICDDDDNRFLTTTLSLEELKGDLFDMFPNKSPRPNGCNPRFRLLLIKPL